VERTEVADGEHVWKCPDCKYTTHSLAGLRRHRAAQLRAAVKPEARFYTDILKPHPTPIDESALENYWIGPPELDPNEYLASQGVQRRRTKSEKDPLITLPVYKQTIGEAVEHVTVPASTIAEVSVAVCERMASYQELASVMALVDGNDSTPGAKAFTVLKISGETGAPGDVEWYVFPSPYGTSVTPEAVK
jgi:hypothetical protein